MVNNTAEPIMTIYTQEQWKGFAAMHEALEEFAFEYVKERFGTSYTINTVFIEFGKIEIEFDDSCRGCNSSDFATCPVEYLWTSEWREELRTAREEEQRITDEKKIARNREDAIQKQIRDKALYLKLKSKFENE